MSLMHVRLELAREDGFPDGSSHHGYEFNVPIDEDGHLDLEKWRERREDCTVKRFWGDEEDLHGHITHNGSYWKFHYVGSDAEEGEAIYKLSTHPLLKDDYLSVTEQDGVQRTFKIVDVHISPLNGGR